MFAPRITEQLTQASGRRSQPWYVGGIADDGVTSLSLTALTGGYWSAAAAEDIVVVASICYNAAQNPTITTSGYTQIVNETQDDLRLIVAYKVMTSTPDTSVGVATTDRNAVAAWVWRGVKTSNVIDATTTIAKAASASPANPAITTVTSSAIVIAIGAIHQEVNFITPNIPAGISGMVQLARDRNVWSSGNVTRGEFVGASYLARGIAGSYTPAVWTGAQITRWIAATIALRPA